jgi:hypothetical protein
MTAPPQTQAVQTGSAPGGIGDGGKTITDLIVVTIPAVLLYFISWVYLYFYLGSFGVSVSELDLDVQTIFIYFLPPVRLLAEFFLEWLLAHWIIVAAVLAIAIAAFIAPATSGLVKRSITATWGVTSRIFGGLNKLPIILQCVVIFIFLIISGVAATPLIQSASAYAAGKVWAPPSTAIAAIVKTDS